MTDCTTEPRADAHSDEGTAEWGQVSLLGPSSAPVARAVPARVRHAGLDGLRGLAVAAVVVFHLDFSLLPGGFLGVDIFFVLSGFLITDLLVAELLRTGRVGLGRFYARRARRLGPAAAAVIITVAAASVLRWHDQLPTLPGSVASSLTYATNWWLILDHQSYFVATGRPPMLQHLWSLAIEEQFYLLWPLTILAAAGVLSRKGRYRDPASVARRIAVLAAGLAVLSTLTMAVLALVDDLPFGGSMSRVYFGTDTHSMGLLLGSAGGAWSARRRTVGATRSPRVAGRRPAVTDLVGIVALLAVARTVLRVDEYSPALYRGGFLLFDALVLVAVCCAVRTAGRLGRALDTGLLRWLGQRSYSIYLWHWPVCAVTRPELDIRGPEVLINCARIILIVGLAEASYRYIEVPFRRQVSGVAVRPGASGPRRSVSAAIAVAAAALTLIGCGTGTDGRRSTPVAVAATPPHDPVPAAGSRPDGSAAAKTPAAAASRERRRRAPGSSPPTSPPPSSTAPPPPVLSAYGDSVLLGALPALGRRIHRLSADAVEGRQATDVLDDISAAAATGTVGRNVLIDTGDNGPISPRQLRSTLAALADRRRVVLLTIRVPRDWQDRNNATIASVARSYRNVTVVDWHAATADHPEWLYGDGIHLSPAGQTNYVRLVVNALKAPQSP